MKVHRVSGECVFCDIVAGEAPATVVRNWSDAMAFEPINPVTPGHLLVIPKIHVTNAMVEPIITGAVFAHVAELAYYPCNLITSVGIEATQTIEHFHVHFVPRSKNDGLLLPWSNQYA